MIFDTELQPRRCGLWTFVIAIANGDAIAFQQEAAAAAPRRHAGATCSVIPSSVFPSFRFVFKLVVSSDAFILCSSSGKSQANISLRPHSQFILIDKLEPLSEFLFCHVNCLFEHGDRSNPDYPAG